MKEACGLDARGAGACDPTTTCGYKVRAVYAHCGPTDLYSYDNGSQVPALDMMRSYFTLDSCSLGAKCFAAPMWVVEKYRAVRCG